MVHPDDRTFGTDCDCPIDLLLTHPQQERDQQCKHRCHSFGGVIITSAHFARSFSRRIECSHSSHVEPGPAIANRFRHTAHSISGGNLIGSTPQKSYSLRLTDDSFRQISGSPPCNQDTARLPLEPSPASTSAARSPVVAAT